MITVTTPAASHDLTVLDAVKAELGITDRSEDENLERWITQASDAIARHCKRVFAKETVAETFRPERFQTDLILSRFPVTEIASIEENGATLAAADYEADKAKGIVRRLSNDTETYWPTGKITVTYTAGFQLLTDLPSAVERACVVLVNQYRFSAQRDPQERSSSVEGIGASSVFDGAGNGGMSPEVRGLLSPYRNLRAR